MKVGEEQVVCQCLSPRAAPAPVPVGSCVVGPCLISLQMDFDYLLGWKFHHPSQGVCCGVCFPVNDVFSDMLLSAAQPPSRVGGEQGFHSLPQLLGVSEVPEPFLGPVLPSRAHSTLHFGSSHQHSTNTTLSPHSVLQVQQVPKVNQAQ